MGHTSAPPTPPEKPQAAATPEWSKKRGSYIKRSVRCPLHDRRSTSAFVGIVPQGWIFYCAHGDHYLTAWPPAHVKKNC